MSLTKKSLSTKVRNYTLGLLLLLLMFQLIIIAPNEIGVSEQASPITLDENDNNSSQLTAQQVMKGVHLIEAKNDKKEWELWAEKAISSEQGKVWRLKKVKVKFFGENSVNYIVTGDEGEVAVDSKNIEINGNVQMNSSSGYRFKTDKMNYLSEKRQIFTHDPVQVTGGHTKKDKPSKLTGTGLYADLGTNMVKVNKDVRSERELEDGQLVVIESENAEFSVDKNYAKYRDNVTIDYSGSRITGPEAQFDFDKGSSSIQSLLVTGGARITDFSKWATADNVRMLFNEKKFILRGGPRVVQDNDELKGEEIVLLNNGREIQVNRAKAEFKPSNLQGQ